MSASHDSMIKIWSGRDYSIVNNNLEQINKVSSISLHEDKIGVTMIDRKWSMLINSQASINVES